MFVESKMMESKKATMSELKQFKIELEFGGVGFSVVVMYLQSPQEGLSVEGKLPACQ